MSDDEMIGQPDQSEIMVRARWEIETSANISISKVAMELGTMARKGFMQAVIQRSQESS